MGLQGAEMDVARRTILEVRQSEHLAPASCPPMHRNGPQGMGYDRMNTTYAL